MMTAPTRTLIVRLPNWVGDVIMSLPAIHALQGLGIQLFLFGKPWAGQLLEAMNLPFFPLGKSNWQTAKKMASMPQAKQVLLFPNSFSSAATARLAGKQVIGYRTDGRRWLLNQSLTKSLGLHEVEYFWNIARFAAQQWFPELQWPTSIPSTLQLPITDSAQQRVEDILTSHQIHQPFWLLCPFAHGTGHNGQSKIWPHWQALSQKLSDRLLIVCPSKQEEPLCDQLVPQATPLLGLNLQEYAALMTKAEFIIANDSGPLHIAAAVAHRYLGIFGTTDPSRTRPWGGTYLGSATHYPTLEQVLESLTQHKHLDNANLTFCSFH